MQVYLEASHTARSNARTGIQTVVRGLAAGLSKQSDFLPVRWSFNSNALTPLKPAWEANLDHMAGKSSHLPWPSLLQPAMWPLWVKTLGMDYKAPLHLHPIHAARLKGAWLILPELMQGPHVLVAAAYAKQHGMRVAGVFHDAIPWLHPELVLHWSRESHAAYMEAFATLDAVVAVSEHSAQDFIDFVKVKGLPMPPVKACRLASQIFGRDRETNLKEPNPGVVKILCVSTLEPRKNHLGLLAAFENASARFGRQKVELHLVGGIYEKAPEIARAVRDAAGRNSGIFWHDSVSGEQLRNFYRECDFTVFASSIEGFGLPVMESMWFGRPCLCSNEGVIAENAAGGGCLMVNMRDPNAMADGIVKLATDSSLRRELGEQVLRRKLKTWDEYGAEMAGILKGI